MCRIPQRMSSLRSFRKIDFLDETRKQGEAEGSLFELKAICGMERHDIFK